jgi:hypothetical protein
MEDANSEVQETIEYTRKLGSRHSTAEMYFTFNNVCRGQYLY